MDTFVGKKDIYGGISITVTSKQSIDQHAFAEKLKNSLQKWKIENIKGVWFHISLECSNFIPILIEYKFIFHHISSNGHVAILCTWLPEDIPNKIPNYAHTTIGVGAIVMNESEQILVVSENIRPHLWKLPGGFVELNEDLDETAKREVLEETGIKTEFESLILFRHMHHMQFECSDLYFVAKLKPLSHIISKDNYEIHNCVWMNVNEFLNNPAVLEMNKCFLRTYFQNNIHGSQIEKQVQIHGITKRPCSLYNIKYDN